MDTNMAKNIGRAKFVKKAREERAWPQKQLAEVSGVNLRTIQRLEKDGAASFETLMGVAQAFGIDVKELTPTSRTQERPKSQEGSREKVEPQKKVRLLPRLTSGKDLAGIIGGADQFQVEHDEAEDERAVSSMRSILELLKGDIVKWHDADPIGKFNFEMVLSQEIKGLEAYGFYLFGVKRTIPRIVGDERSLVSMCTIYMSHSQSPKIIRDKRSNMAIPAVLTEVAS